jgi:hypothetical protein
MDLNGIWKGKYKYGKSYPKHLRGKSEKFEFFIAEQNGVFMELVLMKL